MATITARFDRNASSTGSFSGNPLKGKTVLIVEDSATQRKKLRSLYEAMGFDCVGEAADGLEGLVRAEELEPDLISLDLLMPVMHGAETLKYLREADCKSIIVMVSALGNLESVVELRTEGHTPDAVFSKQDSREMFVEVLREVFAARDAAELTGGNADEGELPEKLKDGTEASEAIATIKPPERSA